ncbi:MAG: hypothetical protein HOO92_02790 [Methylococcaceae bacterium]|nr:hypothetical protein [Methylococcaceae bacterium]
MKFIKIIMLLVAVLSIAGMAFFQLLLLLVSALFTRQIFHRISSSQDGLAQRTPKPHCM